MAVKHTFLGLLIYVALGKYTAALLGHTVAFWLRRAKKRRAAGVLRRMAEGIFAAGFSVAALAVVSPGESNILSA